MNTWVSVLVSVLASICSGMILFLIQHNLKRQQKAEEARESDKSLQTALILKSLNALGKLTVANSIALRVVAYRLPAVRGQQILPHRIAVGIRLAVLRADVSVTVIRHRIQANYITLSNICQHKKLRPVRGGENLLFL